MARGVVPRRKPQRRGRRDDEVDGPRCQQPQCGQQYGRGHGGGPAGRGYGRGRAAGGGQALGTFPRIIFLGAALGTAPGGARRGGGEGDEAQVRGRRDGCVRACKGGVGRGERRICV